MQSTLWPNHNRILDLVQAVIEEKQEGGKIDKFSLESRIHNDTDVLFRETYSKAIEKEVRAMNEGGYLAKSHVIPSEGVIDSPPTKANIRFRKHGGAVATSLKKKDQGNFTRYEPQLSPIQKRLLEENYGMDPIEKLKASLKQSSRGPRNLASLDQ